MIVTPKGTVKILEFGLGPWTRSGRSHEKRDDIFALGAVLFEIVAGRPFGDEFTPAEQRAISKEVPPELDEIIGRLLTHDANRTVQLARHGRRGSARRCGGCRSTGWKFVRHRCRSRSRKQGWAGFVG